MMSLLLSGDAQRAAAASILTSINKIHVRVQGFNVIASATQQTICELLYARNQWLRQQQ